MKLIITFLTTTLILSATCSAGMLGKSYEKAQNKLEEIQIEHNSDNNSVRITGNAYSKAQELIEAIRREHSGIKNNSESITGDAFEEAQELIQEIKLNNAEK